MTIIRLKRRAKGEKFFLPIKQAGIRTGKAFILSLLLVGPVGKGPVDAATGAGPGWTSVYRVPLPGPANRFDYQSLDSTTGRLYLAHLGAGRLVVFDTRTRKVVADLPGFPHVHGVLAVPDLHRVYATVSPLSRKQIGHLVALDTQTLEILSRTPTGIHPDGLDYDPGNGRIFVSNEWGNSLSVIDARSFHPVGTIPLGGEVGNTRYDASSKRIYSTVQTRNLLVRIDPATLQITGEIALPCRHPHGLWIESRLHQAFVACEKDARLLVVDLSSHRVSGIFSVGARPDVLSFDERRNLLFVASESGWITVFRIKSRTLEKESEDFLGFRAHSILVDPFDHLLYLPLENRKGHPVLEILKWRRQGDSPK
jgi:DNA-binding beta-propeller fold protein YncE